jgi:hypothetical protein
MWKLVLDLGVADAGKQAALRRWPVGPDDFDKLIETKQFTNGADKEAVAMLYRKMSTKQLGGIKQLEFSKMPEAPSVEDAHSLGPCLNMCTSLKHLGMLKVGLNDEACAALSSTLARGALKYFNISFWLATRLATRGWRSSRSSSSLATRLATRA